MGAMDGEAMWAKLSCICILLALLFHLIAFGSTWWAKADPNVMTRKEHIGLWRYCTDVINGGDRCDDFINIITGDWLKAAQSFMTLGFFALLGSVAAAVVAAFVMNDGEPKPILTSVAVSSITAIFILIAVAVFGGKYHNYFINREPGLFDEDSCQLSWAFGIACTSLLLTVASAVLMVMEFLAGRQG